MWETNRQITSWRRLGLLGTALLFLLAHPVHATDFNFGELADGNLAVNGGADGTRAGLFDNDGGEQGVTNVNNGFTWEQDGLTVTVTAFEVTNAPASHPDNGGDLTLGGMISPYLDSGDAGLGVCNVLNGSQCNPSDDDNVTIDELLKLNFDEVVTISDIEFKDRLHGTDFGDATLFIRVDGHLGGDWQQFGIAGFDTDLSGTMFEFSPETNFLALDGSTIPQSAQNQFYINVVTVPIPGTGLFFGAGFVAFMAWRRRQEQSLL